MFLSWGVRLRSRTTSMRRVTLWDSISMLTTHGFLLVGADFTNIDYPGAAITSAWGSTPGVRSSATTTTLPRVLHMVLWHSHSNLQTAGVVVSTRRSQTGRRCLARHNVLAAAKGGAASFSPGLSCGERGFREGRLLARVPRVTPPALQFGPHF